MGTRLKKMKVEEAVGRRLAHDLTRIIRGKFKGAAFRKGAPGETRGPPLEPAHPRLRLPRSGRRRDPGHSPDDFRIQDKNFGKFPRRTIAFFVYSTHPESSCYPFKRTEKQLRF